MNRAIHRCPIFRLRVSGFLAKALYYDYFDRCGQERGGGEKMYNFTGPLLSPTFPEEIKLAPVSEKTPVQPTMSANVHGRHLCESSSKYMASRRAISVISRDYLLAPVRDFHKNSSDMKTHLPTFTLSDGRYLRLERQISHCISVSIYVLRLRFSATHL